MNVLNFTHDAGYPFDVDTLNFMQDAYSIFNTLGELAGNFTILKGCEPIGNSVSDGVVYLNGEILAFKGGVISSSVFIKEEKREATFEDGFLREIEQIRYVTFGNSIPEKTFEWKKFSRVKNVQQISEEKTEKTETEKLTERIEKLERQKSAVPIGLVAIWGKPASVPIPEGWKEYVNLRGLMPIGYDPDYRKTENDPIDYRLNTLLERGGERSHKLNIDQMPQHSHGTINHTSGDDSDSQGSGGAFVMSHREVTHNRHDLMTIKNTGGNQAHNNMPPYRVIQFIEYVGW